jgi:hypothetical protein
LQDDIVDVSSGQEQARQENLILETPENLVMTIDTLVNLQDLHELIVSSSAINPSQEKVHYIPESFASSFPCAIQIFCLLFRV